MFYAVEKSNPSLVSALLRRGADPNVMVLQEGGRGNTPLHFACLLEKYKLAEILLEFGAHPNPVNQYGKTPLQLVPADAVRSTKLFFKKMFEVTSFMTICFQLVAHLLSLFVRRMPRRNYEMSRMWRRKTLFSLNR